MDVQVLEAFLGEPASLSRDVSLDHAHLILVRLCDRVQDAVPVVEQVHPPEVRGLHFLDQHLEDLVERERLFVCRKELEQVQLEVVLQQSRLFFERLARYELLDHSDEVDQLLAAHQVGLFEDGGVSEGLATAAEEPSDGGEVALEDDGVLDDVGVASRLELGDHHFDPVDRQLDFGGEVQPLDEDDEERFALAC